MNKNLEYRLSIKKLYRKSYGLLDDDGFPHHLINFFEFKSKVGTVGTSPIFALHLEPKSNIFKLVMSLRKHCAGGKANDIEVNYLVRLKSG